MLRKLAYIYNFVVTFLKGKNGLWPEVILLGERAVTIYSEHLCFTFFIVEIFLVLVHLI